MKMKPDNSLQSHLCMGYKNIDKKIINLIELPAISSEVKRTKLNIATEVSNSSL